MRKHILLIVIIGILLPIYAQVATPPSAGDGTETNPYEIANLENLYWISADTLNFDKHYIQTENINAAETRSWFGGLGWLPIGNLQNNFNGTYSGGGHIVDSLFCNRGSTDYVGMFGYTYYSTIEDIGVTNIDFTAQDYVGAISGYCVLSTVINSYSTGSVVGNNYAGGHIGSISEFSTIGNSFSFCNVTGVTYVGGLCGYSSFGYMINCYSTGEVTGTTGIGGFIGSGQIDPWEIYDCFWDYENSGYGSSWAGNAKTTAQMKTLSTFTDAGWDFVGESTNGSEDIWDIDGVTNNGYPFLAWMSTGIEDNYELAQNYPNPFNPTTTIRFSIPAVEDVKLSVYNSNGQLVKTLINEKLSRGNHSAQFDAKDINSGIYFYTLQAGKKRMSNKMLLIK